MTRTARAFTLIETMIVVAIFGLLTAATSWSVLQTSRSARTEDVIDQLSFLDRLARQYARRFARPVELRFDLDEQQVLRTEWPSDSDDPQPTAAYRLPRGFSLQRVVTTNQSISSGVISVPCSAQGCTPTYAVLFCGPGELRRWIVFAGLTGQASMVDHDRDCEDIFAMLAS